MKPTGVCTWLGGWAIFYQHEIIYTDLAEEVILRCR